MEITLSIKQAMETISSINHLLSFRGLKVDHVNILNKIKGQISPYAREFQKNIVNEVYDKYVVNIPQKPFITPQRYEEFKAELLLSAPYVSGDQIKNICSKYEVLSDNNKGIPKELYVQYRKEVDEQMNLQKCTIQYDQIEVDGNIKMLIKNLSGNELESLSFLFKEESKIVLAQNIPLMH